MYMHNSSIIFLLSSSVNLRYKIRNILSFNITAVLRLVSIFTFKASQFKTLETSAYTT
jgi:hypothetical protein